MITGSPVSRRVVPLVPPLLSYSSTCSRTQSRGLGMYLAIGRDLHIGVGNLSAAIFFANPARGRRIIRRWLGGCQNRKQRSEPQTDTQSSSVPSMALFLRS